MAAVELEEVVGLQDHVVELEEDQRLVAVEPRASPVEGEHAVDREVPADVAQEADVVSPSSQSALLTITASVGPSPKVEVVARRRCLMLAMLASICSGVSSWRVSSRPEGSPTLVVPPPISAIGLWPVFCHQRSIMICSR